MQEGMRIEWVRLDEVIRWDRNPKDHDIGEISNSIERFGFVSPILMDEGSGKLIAGHGRLDTLMALKASGNYGTYAHPEGLRNDESDDMWLVPVVRGIEFENEDEAEAYLLADNHLTEIGGWLDYQLTQILADHAAKGPEALLGTGWDHDDVDARLEALLDKGKENDEKGTVVISPELFERHDYVVFYFDNEIDWQRMVEEFGIDTVQTGQVGNKTAEMAAQQRGLGRVIDGKVLLDKLTEIQDEAE